MNRQNIQNGIEGTVIDGFDPVLTPILRAGLPLSNCDRATNFSTTLRPWNTQRTRPLICLPLIPFSLSSGKDDNGVSHLPVSAPHANATFDARRCRSFNACFEVTSVIPAREHQQHKAGFNTSNTINRFARTVRGLIEYTFLFLELNSSTNSLSSTF